VPALVKYSNGTAESTGLLSLKGARTREEKSGQRTNDDNREGSCNRRDLDEEILDLGGKKFRRANLGRTQRRGGRELPYTVYVDNFYRGDGGMRPKRWKSRNTSYKGKKFMRLGSFMAANAAEKNSTP